MRALSFVSTLALWTAMAWHAANRILGASAQWLNPIKFSYYRTFDSVTGKEVQWKGVAYYPRSNAGMLNENSLDYFTDKYAHIWKRDIPYLKQLGANLVRLYAVDPSQNHDAFMCALSEAGIYAIIDVAAACHNCAITGDPAPACYSTDMKARAFAIINAFSKYPNLLAFEAGNEINHAPPAGPTLGNAPCQKKLIQEMRDFIAGCGAHGMRQIPVGLSLADPPQREVTLQYYQCAETPSGTDAAEWIGLNPYVFCNPAITQWSDSNNPLVPLLKVYQNLGMIIPNIFTEFGCLNPGFPTIDGWFAQRTWYDAKMIIENMNDYIQGAIAFEYSTEVANVPPSCPYPFNTCVNSNYGLGYFTPRNCDDITVPCEFNMLPNGNNLATQWAEAKLDGATLSSFKPAAGRGQSVCPSSIPKMSTFTWPSDNTVHSCWAPTPVTCNGQVTTPSPPTGPTTAPSPIPTRSPQPSPAPGPSAPASPTPSNNGKPSSAPTTSPTGGKPGNFNKEDNTSSSLSTTAITFISLGAVVGGLALVGVGVLAYNQYQKRKYEDKEELEEAEAIVAAGEQETGSNVDYRSI